MASLVTWIAVGIFILFLGIGLIAGLVRGIKRASLHVLFLVASIILAFFITKPVTNAILSSQVTINGENIPISAFIINMLESSFNVDMTKFASASSFIKQLPSAIVSPIIFIVLALVSYLLFDIIYLIVARLSFGSKRKDFQDNKPRRTFGGLIGLFEGFLFLVMIFAPLTALSNTYGQLAYIPVSLVNEDGETENDHMLYLGQIISQNIPNEIDEVLNSYNKSIVGKVSGLGGVDTLLFDGLSNINIKGQNVSLRKDLLSVARAYNQFIYVYNNIQDGDYQFNSSNFKSAIENIIDSGIFKAVIADTIRSYILNYETIDIEGLELPEFATKIFDELKPVFEQENFNLAQYLKDDLNAVVDSADILIQTGLLEDFVNLEDRTDFVEILKIVGKEEYTLYVNKVITNLFNLHIVDDTMPVLLDYASENIGTAFPEKEGKEDLVIKINTNVDTENLPSQLTTLLKKFLSLNNLLDFSTILNADMEVIVDSIINNPNLEEIIEIAGETLDNLRNFDLLVLPAENEIEKTIYVFDNVLEYYDIKLLGDTVYEYNKEEENVTINKIEINSYTKFFDYIGQAMLSSKDIVNAKDLDEIIIVLSSKLKKQPSLIADILLPFKYMSAMNLNELVYDKFLKMLNQDSTKDILSFSELIALDKNAEAEQDVKASFKIWFEELVKLGNAMNCLNKGAIGDKTYLRYMLSNNFQTTEGFKTFMDNFVNDENFEKIINSILESNILKPTSESLLSAVNDAVYEKTNLGSNLTVEIALNDNNFAPTFQSLLQMLLQMGDNADLGLQEIGTILDLIKTNAKDGGAFAQTFANLIYYLTGDKLIDDMDVTGATEFEGRTFVKQELGVEEGNLEQYYEIEFAKELESIASQLGQ